MTIETALPNDLECIDDPKRAHALLHRLRLEIVARARTPRSATEIAAELRLPRQKVNYHVKELARARFLHPAGRRRKRNMYEQRYVASARAYVVTPELLGPVRADALEAQDRFSATFLMTAAARTLGEVARAARDAEHEGKRLSTLTIASDVRFETAAQRERFAAEIESAIERIVAEHTSPYETHDGSPGAGRPYRLVVACHPVPKETAPA